MRADRVLIHVRYAAAADAFVLGQLEAVEQAVPDLLDQSEVGVLRRADREGWVELGQDTVHYLLTCGAPGQSLGDLVSRCLAAHADTMRDQEGA